MLNRLTTLAVLATSLITFSALAADPLSDAIAHTSKLPARERVRQLEKLQTQYPNNPTLLATISLEWGELSTTQGKPAADQAVKYAERAVSIGPNNDKAHVSLSTAYGRMTDFVDNRTKMSLSRKIRDEANRAIQINPRNDDALYILGRWYYEMANVNVILKLAAKMIYGALPAASNADAQRYLERAVTAAPNRICNHQWLAVVYKAMGKKDAAAKQWKAVLALPAEDDDDRQAQKEARKALRS
jgi:tetratricopeptide (TPR) repeat protein